MDRAILRVSVWELLYADDVPGPVAVDEAVELAKELSTDDSPGFVNGVLGKVMLITPQIRAAVQAVQQAVRMAAGTSENYVPQYELAADQLGQVGQDDSNGGQVAAACR